MKLIVPIGPPGCGKSTFCHALPGFDTYSFADPLYSMLGMVAGSPAVHAARLYNQKEKPLPELQGKTLRHALQTLGTEWGRALIGEDIWVDHLFRRAEGRARVAIDDLRFPNEYAAAEARGALFVRLVNLNAAESEHTHASESHWRGFHCHARIAWSTRAELRAQAARIAAAPLPGT